MTTLNGLLGHETPSFKDFTRRKLITFSRLWEECSQEEAQIVAQEEKMGNEDQALIEPTKKIRRDHSHPRKVRIHTEIRKITLEEIYLVSDAIHVMRKDTSPEIVPE